jgi:hypothetical protein
MFDDNGIEVQVAVPHGVQNASSILLVVLGIGLTIGDSWRRANPRAAAGGVR